MRKLLKHSLYSLLTLLCLTFVLVYSYKAEAQEATTAPEYDIRNDTELTKAIGEHLIIGFRGVEVNASSSIILDINNYGIGGVVLFDYDTPTKRYGRNIISKGQTKKLIADLKKYSDHPIFVSIDAEGGSVNRFKSFKNDAPKILSAQDISQSSSYEKRAREEYSTLSSFLSDLGFNLNFAPVIDVNVNANNPIIGYFKRSFSSDPKKVEALAKIFIEEHRKNHILTSLKHFPGHGSSKTDSHKGFVDVTDTYKRGVELLPWIELVKNNYADSVMVGHIFNKNIDKTYPASLSPKHINTELKKRIGFKGLVISDDLQMGAISKYFGFEKSITQALVSGTDIIILSNNISYYDTELSKRAVESIKDSISDGKISRESIITSANKIRKAKANLIIK